LRILPDSYPIAWDSRAASVDSGRKQHPSCYGKFYPLFLKQGAYSSINDRPAPGILPHEPPHGTCRIQDSARSLLPIGSRRLGQFPAQACLSFITVDLSPRVRGSTPKWARPSPQSGRGESWRTPARGVLPSFLKTYQGPAFLLLRLFSKPPR